MLTKKRCELTSRNLLQNRNVTTYYVVQVAQSTVHARCTHRCHWTPQSEKLFIIFVVQCLSSSVSSACGRATIIDSERRTIVRRHCQHTWHVFSTALWRQSCATPTIIVTDSVAHAAAASMKTSCFLVVLLLAVATGSRLSLAAREGSSLGRELGEFFAKAGNYLTSSGRAGADGWHSAAATEVDASASSLMRHGGGTRAGARKRLKKASVNCIPADMCRRKKVLCGKRCYRTSTHAGAGAGLDHVPSNRCVVRCKKCVPTC